MRIDGENFSGQNEKQSKAPRYVIEVAFDDANTDLHYFTSHDDAQLPASVTTNKTLGVISGLSVTSQKLDPEKNNSSIGTISFNLTDYDNAISTLLNTKDVASKSLTLKRVRVYLGYEQLSTFTDYVLIQTQLVENVSYNNGAYSIKCRDAQRFAKEKIFVPLRFTLRQSVSATATTIPIHEIDDAFADLGAVKHDAGYTDAPSATVYYFKIGDEIIRATGKDTTPGALAFTGCTRGVLNTVADSHDIDSSASNDRQPEIVEVFYLEGPVPKIVYALLTGTLFGDSATLPDNWHSGVGAAYIATSEFTGIGADWWDTSDPSNGTLCRILDPKSQDAKKYIEGELLSIIGAFMPVRADGQLGFRRLTRVLAGASYALEITENECISYGALKHVMESVQNNYLIRWNYEPSAGTTTRNVVVSDSASIAKFGASKVKTLTLGALHGSKTTSDALRGHINALRDRWAGPPLKMSVSVMPSQNAIEVGDVVRINLDNVRDYTGEITSIDRSFEVQSVSVNWVNGSVNLELFGSSATPGELSFGAGDEQQATWYNSEGTDITTVVSVDGSGNIQAKYSSGTVSVTNGSAVVTGVGTSWLSNVAVGDAFAIDADTDAYTVLSVDSDLQITLTENWAESTVSGATYKIGYKLQGGATSSSGIFYYTSDLTLPAGVPLAIHDNVQIKAAGFLTINGAITGRGNGIQYGESSSSALFGVTQSGGPRLLGIFDLYDYPASPIEGSVKFNAAPPINLSWDAGALKGLSLDLRGRAGGIGGSMYTDPSDGGCAVTVGGDGGAGGASLVCISRGFAYGVSADVDLSGLPGKVGNATGCGPTHISASGASGTPGALYHYVDGITNTSDTPKATQLRPEPAAQVNTSIKKGLGLADWGNSGYIVDFLPGDAVAEPDIPPFANAVQSLTFQEVFDVNANTTKISNIEITCTDPIDASNYLHSAIYVRQGSNPWAFVGIATDTVEAVLPVAANGSTYEFEARSVSISGNESASGTRDTLTISNLINPTQSGWLANDYGQIPIPKVSGLEIFGQGNVETFGGRDCKVAWNKVSGIIPPEFGSEADGIGSGAGAEDYYFDFYEVTILDSGFIVRTEQTRNNTYTYTYENNTEDYLARYGTVGAYREFQVSVSVRSVDNRVGLPSKINCNNPKPELLTGVTLSGVFQGIRFQANRSNDNDFRGIRVWMSESSGFTPGNDNIVHDGSSLDFTVSQLKTNTTYYLRYSPYDGYGLDDTNLSSELSVTTQASLAGATVGGFVDTVGIGGAFVATGSDAWADIDPGDTVTIPNGTWRLDMGPVADGGTTYVLRFHDGNGNKTFSIDSAGNGEYGGALLANEFKTATSGQRIEINPSSDNEMHFYGDRGDTTIQELATIGISTVGSDDYILSLGGTNVTKRSLIARGNGIKPIISDGGSNGAGMQGEATSAGAGIIGRIYGTAGSSSACVQAFFDSSTIQGSHIQMNKRTGISGAPTHNPGSLPCMTVNSSGDLYWNVGGSTTWVKLN